MVALSYENISSLTHHTHTHTHTYIHTHTHTYTHTHTHTHTAQHNTHTHITHTHTNQTCTCTLSSSNTTLHLKILSIITSTKGRKPFFTCLAMPWLILLRMCAREDLRLEDFGLKESNFTTGYSLMFTIASPRKYRYAMSFSRQSNAMTTTLEARVSQASLKGRKYSSAFIFMCVFACAIDFCNNNKKKKKKKNNNNINNNNNTNNNNTNNTHHTHWHQHRWQHTQLWRARHFENSRGKVGTILTIYITFVFTVFYGKELMDPDKMTSPKNTKTHNNCKVERDARESVKSHDHSGVCVCVCVCVCMCVCVCVYMCVMCVCMCVCVCYMRIDDSNASKFNLHIWCLTRLLM